MAGWRRLKDSDTWHYCSNCSRYPSSNYVTSSTRPTSGEKCNECLAKIKAKQCS